jgi:tol-pal system-associated acyl-CoA thioesterase
MNTRFVWPVRVYYEDTDAGGVVYYANYLKFTERARTEWLRELGFDQTDLAQVHGIVFVVRSFAIEYLKPARFDDALQVTVELIKVGAGQIDLNQRVMRDDEELATAQVKIVCVRLATMRPVRLPQEIMTGIRHGCGQKKDSE